MRIIVLLFASAAFLAAPTSTSTSDRSAVIVHEWGHLLGYGHSDDPSSIMHADVGVKLEVCQPVKKKGRSFRPQRVQRKVNPQPQPEVIHYNSSHD